MERTISMRSESALRSWRAQLAPTDDGESYAEENRKAWV